MKKDKEWLINELNKTACLKEWFTIGEINMLDTVRALIDQLDEPEKVVIPQFVADYYNYWKDEGLTFEGWFEFNDVYDVTGVLLWLNDNDRKISIKNHAILADIIAHGLGGYEIEQEKLYYAVNNCGETVLFRGIYGIKASIGGKFDDIPEGNKGLYKFTEAEIREFDERYMAFAVEVME